MQKGKCTGFIQCHDRVLVLGRGCAVASGRRICHDVRWSSVRCGKIVVAELHLHVSRAWVRTVGQLHRQVVASRAWMIINFGNG